MSAVSAAANVVSFCSQVESRNASAIDNQINHNKEAMALTSFKALEQTRHGLLLGFILSLLQFISLGVQWWVQISKGFPI